MDYNKMKYYTCPMHPEVIKYLPGMCPECGMNLVVTEKGKIEDKSHTQHKNVFVVKFWVSLVLSIPIVIYSDLLQQLFGWEAPAIAGSSYMSLALASIIFFYAGSIFLTSAWREIKGKAPGMMTLIAIAITTAYLWSIYTVVAGVEGALLWELATLITIMLFGHWMEMKAVHGAQSALDELSKLLPDTAEVVRGDAMHMMPLTEVKEGFIVFVRPGSKIPTDGKIIDGTSEVDESIVTGESKPVTKKVGDEVIAGSINNNGSLKVEVTHIGENTFLAGVMRLVAEAQASKSKLQTLSDRAALYLTVIAVVGGFAALIVWLLVGREPAFAISRMVAVLVIACPHALGLAIPLVASISTTMAAKNGFLVKQRLALEMARNVDVVLFDKTGTLTKGEYGVDTIWAVNARDNNEVLRFAASVDTHSEHYISQSIVKEANRKNIQFKSAEEFERIAGKGVKGIVDGKEVFVGGEAVIKDLNLEIPESIKSLVSNSNKQGKTIIYVAQDKKLAGILSLADVIREESREAIKSLQESGVEVAMITGDSEDVARWVAQDIGIDRYFARVMPEDKSSKIKELQAQGKKVAMVGDGINDAPALMQADLGIAIGAGTNVAIESAGIILIKNDPRDIAKVITLSKLTYTKMIQNLWWAAGYNIVAIPLAAGVLAFKGIILQPAIGAVFMSLSTVIVAINAVMLKSKKL
ncbi:MAG: heavy metal translocating P-type ATPase [Parcubacteria group bacterium]